MEVKQERLEILFLSSTKVAGILADHKFDSRTIITALLHDVVEDTTYSLEDIKKVLVLKFHL